mgnify:CR=1 FL=1
MTRDPRIQTARALRRDASAQAAEADRVLGLEIGADDYVAKPFSLRELVARVRVVLRRRGKLIPNIGSLVLVRVQCRVGTGTDELAADAGRADRRVHREAGHTHHRRGRHMR